MATSTFKTSYIVDSKVLRVPPYVKDALDKAKPEGIELWKFSSDMIMLGLAVAEEMKGDKRLEGILRYDTTDVLRGSLREVLGKKAK